MWIFLAWCFLLFVAGTLYYRQVYSTFKNRGLKYSTPVPFLGSMGRTVLGFEHFSEYLIRMYNQFSGERFFGSYEFTNPMVFIRDLELAKLITIKDFEHFLAHRNMADEKLDPFWSRNLFSMKGQEWKWMRSTLSPAFTSSKIRQMVPLMVEIGDQVVEYVKEKIEQSNSGYVVIKTKDLMSRYANDVIASCAFGLKVESLEEDNQFYTMSKDAATFKLRQILAFFAYNSFPKLMTKLKLTIISQATSRFFRALLSKTLREREEKSIFRPDMINLLLKAKKGKLSHDDHKDTAVGFATVEESAVGKEENKIEWSQDDLIAQALLFVIGGFESSSSIMAITLHELANNTDVQDRLYQEIKEYDAKNNGKLDFNTVLNMVYMDMVVSESLRLWTPGFMMERVCTKDYNLGKPNKNAKEDFIIRKGESVAVPVCAIHRDPQYFEDPNKFNPDRFAEENRHDFNSLAYMPFGVGPRNCIEMFTVVDINGLEFLLQYSRSLCSRFALCELKAILYQILLKFEVCPTVKGTLRINKKVFGVKNIVDDLKFRIRE